MVARPSGVLNRHRGQRFNPYASGYKNNVLVKKKECQPYLLEFEILIFGCLFALNLKHMVSFFKVPNFHNFIEG